MYRGLRSICSRIVRIYVSCSSHQATTSNNPSNVAGQYPVRRWIPPRRRTLSRHLRYATSTVWWRQYYGVGRHNGTWQDTISCCHRTSDRNTIQEWNCSVICYSVHPSSRQQRHIPAGQRWTTCCACFASLPDTAECWCVTVASRFTRSFIYWARLGWNGTTVTLSAKSVSFVWNKFPQAFFSTFIRSMHRRYQTWINANGGHTSYWLC
jgi:hypothetical protein